MGMFAATKKNRAHYLKNLPRYEGFEFQISFQNFQIKKPGFLNKNAKKQWVFKIFPGAAHRAVLKNGYTLFFFIRTSKNQLNLKCS